jgi:anti-sigma factor RsiW
MTTRITGREWEDLSAYLDGQLSPKESARLEEKLQARADLREALNELSQTRSLLRSQPAVCAPRNFTLTSKMVGARPAPARSFQLFPVMRLASVAAAVLLVVVLAGDFLTGGRQPAFAPVAFQSMPMSAPAVEMKSAAEEAAAPQVEAVMEAPAPTESPAAAVMEATAASEAPVEAPLAEAAAQLPAPTLGAAALMDATTGAEPYPPPSEELAAAAAAPAEATATPAPPQPTPLPPEQENLAQRNALEGTDTATTEAASPWSGWRILEIALALLVVVFAGFAFYTRRSRRA